MSKSLSATASAPLVGSTLGSLEQKFFKKENNSVLNQAIDFMPSFQVAIGKKKTKPEEKIMEILEKFRGYYPLKRSKNFREILPDAKKKGN